MIPLPTQENNYNKPTNPRSFNEPEWLKLLFLLSDTQAWLDDLSLELFGQLPMGGKKKFLRKSYFLSVSVMAHILERHYYKIPRYPHAGKFHIPVAEILHHIREAYNLPITPAPGQSTFQRIVHTGTPIGFDKQGQPSSIITILTDAGGNIITAFPGINVIVETLPNIVNETNKDQLVFDEMDAKYFFSLGYYAGTALNHHDTKALRH